MTDDPETPPEDERLDALDKRIRDAESRRRKATDPVAGERGAAQGYQVLGELLGGILGGLGLGWVCDHYLGTKPWGLIVGTIAGLAASVYLITKRSR